MLWITSLIRFSLATLLAIALSGILIITITHNVIDPYLKDTGEWGTSLFNFYKENNESNKIYLIGDSYTMDGIDALEMENALIENNLSFKVYNLAYGGDTPLLRIVELSHIAESQPTMVVFFSAYRWFGTRGREIDNNLYNPLEKRFGLVADKIKLDDFTKSLFNETELNIIQKDAFNSIAYKRRLFGKGLKLEISRYSEKNGTFPRNFAYDVIRSGYLGPIERTQKWDYKYQFINERKNQGNVEDRPNATWAKTSIIDMESDNQTLAFRYILNYLKERGIHVVIINMPKHPYIFVNNDTRKNYLKIVKSCYPYYDLENLLTPNEFLLDNHANKYGRIKLTHEVGKIVLKEIKNVSK